jgi:hypothetical protein
LSPVAFGVVDADNEAARATTEADYNEAMKQMRAINVARVNYLEKTADKKYGVEAFCEGVTTISLQTWPDRSIAGSWRHEICLYWA